MPLAPCESGCFDSFCLALQQHQAIHASRAKKRERTPTEPIETSCNSRENNYQPTSTVLWMIFSSYRALDMCKPDCNALGTLNAELSCCVAIREACECCHAINSQLKPQLHCICANSSTLYSCTVSTRASLG